MEIPISLIHDFPDHPYKVKDDENMLELVESIKTRGLIQPVLVRPLDDGTYEMVSGHRRKRAFELANIEKIPARVQELTKDEAILSMVDSNLQRDEILPSEKAFAFKMRLDAMKRQGYRTDLQVIPLYQQFTHLRLIQHICELLFFVRSVSPSTSKLHLCRQVRLSLLLFTLIS